MRVFIADDESLVRLSLRSMLEELDSFPVRIVEEAANGEEMIERLKECQPDIAFVDVRMPKCNGLEAIKTGKTISPRTQWVILTGFSEFSYAQEAIRLGAANYLLKPASPEELEKVLHDLYLSYQDQLKRQNKAFANEMMALFHGLSAVEEINGDGLPSNSRFLGAVFYVDSHLPEKTIAERLRKSAFEIQRIITKFLSPDSRIALFPLPNGEWMTIGCWGFTNGSEGKKRINLYFDEIKAGFTRFSAEDLSITMIHGKECHSIDSLYRQASLIQEHSPCRTVVGMNRCWRFEDLQIHHKDSMMRGLSELLISISKFYKEKRYLEFMKTLTKLEKYRYPLNDDEKLWDHAQKFLKVSTGCEWTGGKDFNTWLNKLQAHGENLLTHNQKDENRQHDAVDQVIAFIDQHYMNDIGIGQIAETLGVTPNYLSTLFRKKTGTTFMKYLTRIRMLKAKELLTKSDIQVQQVAEQVGYYSVRHFTKLFTEFAGCYPSEYRKQQKHIAK
ncbi:response regulator transcription factor [Laceyella putida]|uniref:Helix-turn-helix domain-containing protein n=1 Tax=Laceyella putida TaxID=110101 RepID=A0ABW2RM15_9BACL